MSIPSIPHTIFSTAAQIAFVIGMICNVDWIAIGYVSIGASTSKMSVFLIMVNKLLRSR